LNSQKALEACYESAKTGKVIELTFDDYT